MENLIGLIISAFNTLQQDANQTRDYVDELASGLRAKVNEKTASGRYKFGLAKREALLMMIRGQLYNLRMNHLASAYLKDGELYINHVTTPAGIKNSEELIGTGLSVEEWNSLRRRDVWIKTGVAYW